MITYGRTSFQDRLKYIALQSHLLKIELKKKAHLTLDRDEVCTTLVGDGLRQQRLPAPRGAVHEDTRRDAEPEPLEPLRAPRDGGGGGSEGAKQTKWNLIYQLSQAGRTTTV